ncbi:MAG: acyl-CoA dehydrogenase, partial [Dehalococcoidia bacterium]|nr:acyl-CoA dehydrogenase [Dehalococcoidia bacterium]
MIEVKLDEADQMIRDVTRRFVDDELIPLEQQILRAEAEDNWYEGDDGRRSALSSEQRDAIQGKAREIGLYNLDLSVEQGGPGLTEMQKVIVYEELARTITPLALSFDAPNIRMLEELATEYQQEHYLMPLKRGEKTSCFMLTEPEAGGDARGIRMPATRDGDNWVLNGTKL